MGKLFTRDFLRKQPAFLNIKIALRMYVVLTETNSKRRIFFFFSKTKLTKNRLQASVKQNRLSSFALFGIENHTLRSLDFLKVIDKSPT